MRRGLVATSGQARGLIAAGRVLVGGAPTANVARLVGAEEPIRLEGPAPRFVSRGGDKVDAALDRFRVDVQHRRVLDAGASTGGFTDCVLQRGAREVVAVDVGHGQLHERLRQDPGVNVLERTNIRTLEPASIGGVVDVVVADLSFISLRTAARNLVAACRPGGDLVLLVKPQFEAKHAEASRGRGVIKDPEVWHRTLLEVGGTFGQQGAAIMGAMVSPLRGAQGNVEFFLHAVADGSVATPALGGLVAAAVTEVDEHSAGEPVAEEGRL
ncbi:MAG: TlyA family RNA methyltransferase [Actinomycetota bacterium]|nr:TlyA family RNA methyltransferase [Actinomycetota bacterium]